MLEIIKERLNSSVYKSVSKIDEIIAAIEKLLDRLILLREFEIELLGAFGCEESNFNESSSVDAKIDFLRKYKEELYKEQEQSLLLLKNFDRLFQIDGGYPTSNGGAKMICVTVDELSAQANDWKVAAEMISSNADSSLAKVHSIFDDDTSQETEEMFDCIYEYSLTVDELTRVCYETSTHLREMGESYSACEAKVMSGVLDLFKRKKKVDDNVGAKGIVPPPQVDSVQFSAVAPNKVIPGKYIPISIVMYEDSFRKNVDDIVRSIDENAKESKSGYHDVERNSVVKVVLSSPDVTIEDDIEERTWSGKYLNFEFTAKVPSDFSEEQILFSAAVYVNDIITTRLKLILDCEGKPKRNVSVTRSDIISAFVSYASQDRNRVASIIQGMKKARPDMDIFFDIENLRSGQKWEETLKNEIESRDILFLCWSRFAKDSKWVDMEWRYALESKGEECIEPIPIDSPDICPPPAELQQKHFNDKMLYIIKATMPVEGD